MLKEPKRSVPKKVPVPFIAQQSGWVRASASGFVNHKRHLGHFVRRDEVLAVVSDPYGVVVAEIRSVVDGIIIGKQNIPLVQEGEAMYHIAYLGNYSSDDDNVEVQHIKLQADDWPDDWVED